MEPITARAAQRLTHPGLTPNARMGRRVVRTCVEPGALTPRLQAHVKQCMAATHAAAWV